MRLPWFWVENHLWGLEPRGYHFVNLALHAASCVLLWRILLTLAVPGAWLAAAIFAVHPVQVETVAWITERKNVLSCLLALVSIWAYLKFSPPESSETVARNANVKANPWVFYGLALACYVLALFSKTVVCSVPAVLIVIYWWKRGLESREWIRLAPFFAIGLILASVTVWMERVRVEAVGDEWDFSPLDRVLIAGRALWFYAGKLAWPDPLMFFYPRWTIDDTAWWQYLFPAAALGVMVALWALSDRIGRGPLAGVLIFAGVLVPALGFFNVYPFRFSFVADHFQYHASIGLITLAAAGLTLGVARLRQPWLGVVATIGVLAPLAVIAHQQTYVYRGLQTLYEDTIAKNPTSWVAHHNLGSLLESQGERVAAIEHYREAVRLDPDQARLRTSLGIALTVANQHEEGEKQLAEVLALDSSAYDRSYALTYLGNIRAAQKRYDEAFADYREAIAAKHDNWHAYWFYSGTLAARGDTAASIEMLRVALRLNPDDARAQHKLGMMLASTGQLNDAVKPLKTAVQLNPNMAAFRVDLGVVLFHLDRSNDAESELRAAVQLDPNNPLAHNTLGAVYAVRKDFRSAIQQFQATLAIDPNFADARLNLEQALQDQLQSPGDEGRPLGRGD